jgi:TolA-binding protein
MKNSIKILSVLIIIVSGLNAYDESIESLKYKIAQQKERMDGLTQIVEGLGRTINELRQNRSGGRGSRYSDEELVSELGRIVDNINENYVSKSELRRAISKLKNRYKDDIEDMPKKIRPKERIYTQKEENIENNIPQKEVVIIPRVFEDNTQYNNPPARKENSSQSNLQLYTKAVKSFNKKNYNEAREIFKDLDKKAYKNASTNYYLGEISYYTKNYEDAIFYFKKSAGFSTESSYMHALLLHTAISLEKEGNKKEAIIFYQNILDNYPNDSSVAIAKIRLKELK